MYLKMIANFAGEVAQGIEQGNLADIINRPLEEWLFGLQESAFFASQRISINSPGQNFLQSVKMTPILAVVFFALCQYPAAVIKAAELQFKNSATGGPLDECDIPVAEGARIAFDLMSLEKLEQMCIAARKAEEMGRIRTPVRTKLVNDAE